jgi:hypothetical protein
MRKRVNRDRIERFMNVLGHEAKRTMRVYLVGGASAVLFDWRESTIDIDLKLVPDSDEVLRSLPKIKEELEINLELASPDDFIPPLPGWEERSRFINRIGKIEFFHYDFYAQALAKIERGHEIDTADVDQMVGTGLIERDQLLELFTKIESELYKYPAIDPKAFREAVELVTKNN